MLFLLLRVFVHFYMRIRKNEANLPPLYNYIKNTKKCQERCAEAFINRITVIRYSKPFFILTDIFTFQIENEQIYNKTSNFGIRMAVFRFQTTRKKSHIGSGRGNSALPGGQRRDIIPHFMCFVK